MRSSRLLLLAAALVIAAACSDPEAPSPTGTLVVSTSTGGDDPDEDGYLLTIDGAPSLPLDPTGVAELSLPSGRHSLRLDGVARHCSADREMPLEVDVPARGTLSVAFEITCMGGAVQVTTTTTGLDIDADGYQVVVDGIDRGTIPSNGTLLVRVARGSRMITLTGIVPSCAVDGPASRAVTVGGSEVVPLAIPIVCTAATGVIGVLVETSGAHPSAWFELTIDGAGGHYVGLGVPLYVDNVSGGHHLVALRSSRQCSVSPESQPLTIAIGEPVRDTVTMNFSVTCAQEVTGTVRITAPTRGTPPGSSPYHVRYQHYEYWGYGGVPNHLADVEPNDTLIVELPESNEYGADPYWYLFYLADAPGTCRVDDPNPPQGGFTITHGDTLEVEFAVSCLP